MKKIYILPFSLMMVGGLFAQTKMSKTIESPRNQEKVTKPQHNVATKAVVYTNDFSNAADWVISNSPAPEHTAGPWVISTNVNAAPVTAFKPLNFTTAANGFAIVNSDAAGNGQKQSTYIKLANSISIPAGAYKVTFENASRNFYDDYFLMYSIDGGTTWDSVQVNTAWGVNTNSANPATTSVPLPTQIGGQANVKIGFKYVAEYAWFWAIDDIKIETLPDNDLTIFKGWHDDVINDFEYSMMPLTQARALKTGVIVTNNGALAQNSVGVTCEIFKDGGSTPVYSSTINHNFLVGATDTIWFDTQYTPSTAGVYTTKFSLPTDANTADNTYNASSLEMNSNLFAHDYCTANTTTSIGWPTNDPTSTTHAKPYSWGELYYPTVNQTVYGLDVNFATGTSTDVFLEINCKELTGNIQQAMTLKGQIYHTPVTSEIGNGVKTTLIFDSPISLVTGKVYLFEIKKINDGTTTEALRIGSTDANLEDDDRSAVAYGPFGTNNAINYYSGWDFGLYIRPNFDQSLAVNKIENNINVKVYPNPSNGIVNIDVEKGNNTIVVTDLSGKEIMTKTINGTSSIDLSNYGSGVYFVKVSSEKGSAIERVVIK